ncbi:unnamed protein product [Effrenium voratum]|nr:unnamed protein product [Effrenium voratum]
MSNGHAGLKLHWRPASCLFALFQGALSSSLVGPGAVGSFQGGGGGRRFAGYAQVTEPPVGFFIGGSSIRGLNGLYSREQHVPGGFSHSFTFSYRHDYTGWRLCLVGASDSVRRSTGRQTEWVLIDPDKADRLRHDGDQLIPGSGRRWSHVHRTKDTEPNLKAGSAVAQAVEDDDDELPWQVVGVGAQEMLERLKRYFNFYKHEVQAAISGRNLPALPLGGKGLETGPPDGFSLPSAVQAAEASEADGTDACLEGPASLENVEAELPMADSPWASAVLELRRARCHRRQRKLEESEAIGAALSLFPRFAAAMEEQGKLRIDQGRYQQAIHSFETLLHIDRRTWPSLADWLVRVHTLKRRQESDVLAEKAEVVAEGRTSQCLAWRQTGGCSPTGVLEPSADKPCTAAIVNGNSGFCQCTPLGARGASGSAAESTCDDHVPFTCAQKCAERQQAESGQRPKLSEEEARLAAEVAKVAEATPCSLLRGGHVPEWCHSDHYRVLGLRCDFAATEESEELKRAYKRRSLQYHPDKPGGSALAFQRVADAHQVLLDPSKRRAFDEGSDFPRKRQQDGSEGETHKEEVEKKYFPDRFDFQPFGDPHSDRREAKARQDKLLERRRQEALARGARAEL